MNQELAVKNTVLAPAVEPLLFGKNLLHTCALMAGYAGQASLGRFRHKDHHSRLGYFTRNVGKYTRRVLRLFNVDLSIHGYNPQLMLQKNFLLVSNHMSYIDILVLSSVQPCVFVTSVDLGESFFLGPMAEMGGSIFVERRNRRHIGRDLGIMADTLRAGHHVVIYPEGTSSNGEGVLPFKKSLLMSAIEAGVDVMPMTIKYKEIDGEPFAEHNRDRLCWYGDMDFFPHFLGLMKVKHVKVELHFHDPISVTKESSRHEIADQCYRVISESYGHPFQK